MRAAGRREGANYSDWKWWPNTTHASRLLLFAEKRGEGDRLLGELYQMCYDEGENVSLKETVAKAAERAGVHGGAEYAISDQGMEELRHALGSARVNGKRVSAAPWFHIRVAGLSHDFSGAQETERWTALLEHCAEIE